MSWNCPPPNWNCPAGRAIDRFLEAVSREAPDPDRRFTVFGSAVIQLRGDGEFMSGDADLIVGTDRRRLEEIALALGLSKAENRARERFYLELCGITAFRTTAAWHERTHREVRHGIPVVIPHVRDVLIGKLHRHRPAGQAGLSAKDLRAFLRVRELTGHPTEEELLADLRLCPHAWQLPLSGVITDFRLNVEDLWPALYGHRLDITATILRPLMQELEELGYAGDSREFLEMVRALTPLRP